MIFFVNSLIQYFSVQSVQWGGKLHGFLSAFHPCDLGRCRFAMCPQWIEGWRSKQAGRRGGDEVIFSALSGLGKAVGMLKTDGNPGIYQWFIYFIWGNHHRTSIVSHSSASFWGLGPSREPWDVRGLMSSPRAHGHIIGKSSINWDVVGDCRKVFGVLCMGNTLGIMIIMPHPLVHGGSGFSPRRWSYDNYMPFSSCVVYGDIV